MKETEELAYEEVSGERKQTKWTESYRKCIHRRAIVKRFLWLYHIQWIGWGHKLIHDNLELGTVERRQKAGRSQL
jgi:hypothetical protein